MVFDDDVIKIRRGLARYTTGSVVTLLLKRLHADYADQPRAYARPWVTCLLLEWAFEVKPNKGAVEATSDDVYKLLNKVWELQSLALSIEATDRPWLPLRSFMLTQLRFQQSQQIHIHFLARLYAIMCKMDQSTILDVSFEKDTGIKLYDFFVISGILISFFLKKNSVLLKYSDLLVMLHPAYSIDTIIRVLSVLGGNEREIKSYYEDFRENYGKVRKEEYFAEPKLLKFPLFLLPEGLSTAHSYVATIGISEFVLRTLKNSNPQSFRQKFTRLFENYMSVVFKENNCSIVKEVDLKQFYKEKQIQGRVVDFLYNDGQNSVFIDAKGVEPKEKALTTDNPALIKNMLRDIHIKGIRQAADCVALLEKSNYAGLANKENRYALIVTHQDFYLSDGIQLKQYFEEKEYQSKVIDVVASRIPEENIHFCSIAELEGILCLCEKLQTVNLGDFMKFCTVNNSKFETRMFEMRQHIESFAEEKGIQVSTPIGTDFSTKEFSKLMDVTVEKIEFSKNYWRVDGINKIPEFMKKLNLIKIIS
ncbi:hypothetical protein [Aliivibrio fischeri]|uniref:GapS1 family protein n=1 Tax=Aliivibrio fischeri TaxID=668 RepID=UPI00105D2CD9|nr:hypothetical protein [Aliivibrio fischeri]TDM54071.1 hypothetical protein VFFQA001_05710 [Aliivibrio fischeri]